MEEERERILSGLASSIVNLAKLIEQTCRRLVQKRSDSPRSASQTLDNAYRVGAVMLELAHQQNEVGPSWGMTAAQRKTQEERTRQYLETITDEEILRASIHVQEAEQETQVAIEAARVGLETATGHLVEFVARLAKEAAVRSPQKAAGIRRKLPLISKATRILKQLQEIRRAVSD